MKDYSEEFGRGGLNKMLDVDEVLDGIGLDREEIRWRKDFIGFGPQDEKHLSGMEGLFRENAEQVADDFYENLSQYDETVEVISRSEKALDGLKRTQSAYLVTLATGEYDMSYFEDRARIGKIHDLLEMPMKHYIGQYGVYYDLIFPLLFDRMEERLAERIGEQVAAATDGGTVSDAGDESTLEGPGGPGIDTGTVEAIVEEEMVRGREEILAVLRIINLDMQIVVDSYIDSYSKEIEEKTREQQELMERVERDLEQPISNVSRSAADVAESTSEVSGVVTEQTEAMESVAGDIAEMSATIEEIASTAEEVASTSEQAEGLAEGGRESADDALEAMEKLETAVEDVTGNIRTLEARMEEVSEITGVINDIAEQTNMLALNASIEAARAGEAGEGFAVVADEIKSLANESKENAADIEETIQQAQSETDETVRSLEEARDRFGQGTKEVNATLQNLDEIVQAAQETAQGIQEVSDATDDQAATTEQVASTIDDLVDDLDEVRDEIDNIAAANEEQTAEIKEIEETAGQLTDQR